jgi:hypothetical protein
MNQASEFDDQESLNIPEKHLLALISNSEEGGQVVEALRQSGFKSEDIGFLSGTESAAKIDAASEKKGLLAKLATSGIDVGAGILTISTIPPGDVEGANCDRGDGR